MLLYRFDLDAKTLNCVSRHDPVKEFGLQALSSHPLTDPETGETYNVGLDIVPSAKWKVVKFPAQCGKLALKETIKKGKIIAVHPCRAKLYAPWLHSFGMSKNYVVWIDQPCHFSVTKALKAALKGFCPREVMEWSPEKKNQFYLLNKKTLKVLKTEIISKDAIFFNHFLTCHEENGHVILDLFGMPGIQYCDVQVLAKLRSGKVMQDKDCPRLYRFVIPLIGEHDLAKYPQNKNLVRINSTAKAVRIGDKLILEPELMSEIAMDFATWNKKLFSGEQIRFIWTTGALCPSVHHHKVAKFDVKTRKFLTWEAEQDQHVGEPCLIPRSGAIEQDDGLIVLFVNNYLEELGNEKRKDFLIWLNAKDLKEVGRAYFYSEIPIALHSIWMSN
ncbi:beta,beta-carotene 15,15'-dioxygenase-like [Folsomia candida]|uniref:beta,beta-carotene 15,15'-dioxygenase-like n=1 Tax=Folsomia candida TaxID=158441 RepID=UPI0016052CEE|nr:beta,beta-carotene 15,15'-dioxygenase-like [Folsomia candida]